MKPVCSGDRVAALGHLGGALTRLPYLLLLAGYTLNADAGPLDGPPPASLPPAGSYDTDPARTQLVDEFEALPVLGFLKVLLRDGIRHDFDRYHSLKLGLFDRLADGPGGVGQVFLQWRIALD
ncbi:MAG: hypothetical protein ACREXX_13755 [Gammaproteobacteria bacterium]